MPSELLSDPMRKKTYDFFFYISYFSAFKLIFVNLKLDSESIVYRSDLMNSGIWIIYENHIITLTLLWSRLWLAIFTNSFWWMTYWMFDNLIDWIAKMGLFLWLFRYQVQTSIGSKTQSFIDIKCYFFYYLEIFHLLKITSSLHRWKSCLCGSRSNRTVYANCKIKYFF